MPGPLSPSEINARRQKDYNATVVGLIKVHSDLAIFRVKPDFAFHDHKPGQYTTLGLGNWEPRIPGCEEETLDPGEETRVVRRAYSISHPVLDAEGNLASHDPRTVLEFYVVLVRKLEKEGAPALTPRLFMLQEGDRLYVGEKVTGHYTLDAVSGPDRDVVLFSTGTGEAPHNYMVWELLRGGHQGSIVTACCARYLRDLAYLPMHQRLMEKYPSYLHIPLTTREPGDVGRKMYIQDLIVSGELERRMGRPLDPARTHIFLCGNPSMIGVPHVDRQTGARTYPRPAGVVEVLEQRGFSVDQPRNPGNIHFEKYW